MGLVDQSWQRVAVDAGRGDGQSGLDAEARGDLAGADLTSNGSVCRQWDFLLAGDILQRTEKAGRITGGEQLLRVCAWAAGAAQFARGGQLHVEHIVGFTDRGGSTRVMLQAQPLERVDPGRHGSIHISRAVQHDPMAGAGPHVDL